MSNCAFQQYGKNVNNLKNRSMENNTGRGPRRTSSPFLSFVSSHSFFSIPWLVQETLTQRSLEQASALI